MTDAPPAPTAPPPATGPLARMLAFARRQPVAELAHQHDILARFALRRRALVTLAFGIGLAYQPFWIMAAFYLADVVFDLGTLRLLRGLDPARNPFRYLAALAANTALSVTFTGFPALNWLVDAPLAKAYALGLVLIALIHHSTLRNVHLPLSVSATSGATVVAATANLALWAQAGDWRNLAITSLCLAAAVYYAALTIAAMHRLQAELLREREVARQASLAKTRFVAQLSHELRTPLNAIIGLSEAERMMAPQPETQARMGVLVQSARDLGDLLEDILDLSAIEAGQMPIRPATLDPGGQIRSTVQLFRRQFEDAGMRTELAIDSGLPGRVWLDGTRLRQCLSNILSNAVKYGRSGPVRILAWQSAPGWLMLRVEDSGPGVDPALRERIFEPFVRGREDRPGTGLGLAISRMLARRMGGDLVLAPDGPGASFVLTLPFGPAPAPTDRPAAADLPARFDGLRVLVVDDIATNRLVAATYLRILGAEALQASDGAVAIDVTLRESPDLILMDLLMPGLNGVETRERLQELMGSDLPPMVALSAEPALLPHSAGFDAHLVKPLTLEKLREALAVLGRAQA